MNSAIKIFILLVFFTLFVTACNNQSTPDNKETEKATIAPTEPDNDDGETFVEEGDYISLKTPYDTENNNQVVVYEFFGYTCPHCYTFEPYLNKWLENKPDYVKFVRVPMNFQPRWANFQQAYLTAEIMGIADQAHSQMFAAIHKEHKPFRTLDAIAQWYADNTGVDKDAFLSTSDSFILDSKIRKADSMGFKMQITSTPTLVINGKYKAAKRKNREEIMEILDFLIEKEAKSMGLLTN